MNNINENDLSKLVVHACYTIHSQLGPGLFESVYEEILCHEFRELGLQVERQKVIPVTWKGMELDQGFRADLIVNNKLLIELKSVEAVAKVHQKQVLTYLKLTKLKLGLLVNFNEALIKDGIQRIVNKL